MVARIRDELLESPLGGPITSCEVRRRHRGLRHNLPLGPRSVRTLIHNLQLDPLPVPMPATRPVSRSSDRFDLDREPPMRFFGAPAVDKRTTTWSENSPALGPAPRMRFRRSPPATFSTRSTVSRKRRSEASTYRSVKKDPFAFFSQLRCSRTCPDNFFDEWRGS